ncbi:MAG: hypothetical protein ACRDT4_26690 [Micromonosporaceae bacterium]
MTAFWQIAAVASAVLVVGSLLTSSLAGLFWLRGVLTRGMRQQGGDDADITGCACGTCLDCVWASVYTLFPQHPDVGYEMGVDDADTFAALAERYTDAAGGRP